MTAKKEGYKFYEKSTLLKLGEIVSKSHFNYQSFYKKMLFF